MKTILILVIVILSVIIGSESACDIKWIPWSTSKRDVPKGTMGAGSDKDGNLVSLIRAKYGPETYSGKFKRNDHCAYIPVGGDEICVKNFEVMKI